MKILGIETSCDETAAAIVADGSEILSNILTSSLPFHSKTGGIIPEIAAREQIKSIIPVIEEAVKQSSCKPLRDFQPLRGLQARSKRSSISRSVDGYKTSIDAIAVTYGPGLIGSLLVGVEAARVLSYVLDKPLIPVNHLIGHLYSAWLQAPKPPKFPVIALIVSGGHTELLLVRSHGRWKHLGGTKDDAAGEAFDKTARLLGLGYPGGPAIEKASLSGNPSKFNLPRPLINEPSYDFSFSGLKTATTNLVNQLAGSSVTQKINTKTKSQTRSLTNRQIIDLSASIQEAVVDVLVAKTLKAAGNFNARNIVLGGGVAANKRLREKMMSSFGNRVYYSEPKYSVDNGAMIAAAAYFNFYPVFWGKVKADPSILI
ncbi:MAG TPA: tRNA (adenosine(37)-N6)-threonylcarbamoyltransferase complex transferase subunit TsaD [Candidatus Nanoarchaeia archaeon]